MALNKFDILYSNLDIYAYEISYIAYKIYVKQDI